MFTDISVVVRSELEQFEIDLSQSDLHVNVRMRTDLNIDLNKSDPCVHAREHIFIRTRYSVNISF